MTWHHPRLGCSLRSAADRSFCTPQSEQNDYGAYLDFLKDHRHNFIRLWRWEHFKSQAADGSFHRGWPSSSTFRSGSMLAGPALPHRNRAASRSIGFHRCSDQMIVILNFASDGLRSAKLEPDESATPARRQVSRKSKKSALDSSRLVSSGSRS